MRRGHLLSDMSWVGSLQSHMVQLYEPFDLIVIQ